MMRKPLPKIEESGVLVASTMGFMTSTSDVRGSSPSTLTASSRRMGFAIFKGLLDRDSRQLKAGEMTLRIRVGILPSGRTQPPT